MPIRTSIALAAAAFLGFATVAQANSQIDTQFRQVEGFSFHYGPQGQYLGSTPPRPSSYSGSYDYSPSGSVHRNHRKGTVPATNDGRPPPSH